MHRTMTRPLALRWLHGSTGWASIRIETATVGGASTTNGELAFFSLGLDGLDLLPFCLHEASRVPGSHEECGEQHHATLEDHERNLFIGELTFESMR